MMHHAHCPMGSTHDSRFLGVRVAAWTLNPQYSQRLSFRRLRITAPELGAKGHNTDGFGAHPYSFAWRGKAVFYRTDR